MIEAWWCCSFGGGGGSNDVALELDADVSVDLTVYEGGEEELAALVGGLSSG